MTEPPADLIEKLGEDLHAIECGCPVGSDETHLSGARTILAALAEWADGALIDPDGWRRLDATHPGGIAYCIVHDEPAIEAHDPTGDCRPDSYGCIERNLHVLTPRETTP